jgi:hypothetical protein
MRYTIKFNKRINIVIQNLRNLQFYLIILFISLLIDALSFDPNKEFDK